MPLSPLPFRTVKRKLEAAGHSVARQEGSHIKFVLVTPTGVRTAIVPRHREVTTGTLRSIPRQTGITVDEWLAL